VGTDVTVFGTAGDDQFAFNAANSRSITINGVRYNFAEEELTTVSFDAGDGSDTVILRDSFGDESLEAWPDRAHLVNAPSDSIPDFTVEATGIEHVLAYAVTGGHDTATLHGSIAADKFKSYEEYVRLRAKNSSYSLRAKGFDSVSGDAGPGGNDVAVFDGSDANDVFSYDGDVRVARIESPGRDHRAENFAEVLARAGEGDADVAHFNDLPGGEEGGDDVFYYRRHKTVLVNPTVKVTARRFDEVHASASQTGFDVAEVYDTPQDEHFEFDGNAVRMYQRRGDELDLLYEAIAFERVRAYRSEGTDTKAEMDHTFELYLYGWDA
jgi:hypothetical protein